MALLPAKQREGLAYLDLSPVGIEQSPPTPIAAKSPIKARGFSYRSKSPGYSAPWRSTAKADTGSPKTHQATSRRANGFSAWRSETSSTGDSKDYANSTTTSC